MKKLRAEFAGMGRAVPGCGIGLNTGDMILGNIGTSQRQNYTVLGKSVNLASRLCGAAKEDECLVTETTLASVLKQLPRGWRFEQIKDDSTPAADGSGDTLSGKVEQIAPLDEKHRGLQFHIFRITDTGEESCAMRFRYLFALKVKGIDKPMPVISLSPSDGFEDRPGEMGAETQSLAQGERIFGKYRLEAPIGKGGIGEVWKGRDQFGNHVAIKILRSGDAATDAQIARFKREAEIMAKLSHRNIVRIHEVGNVEGIPFIAMELIDGADLSDILAHASHDGIVSDLRSVMQDILKDKTSAASSMGVEGIKVSSAPIEAHNSIDFKILPIQQTLSIMEKVCAAIQFAHEHGIMHRDLKPSNIMLREDGEPVVMDFGLAKMEQADAEVSLSMTGQIVGTIEYMAPEQARSSKDIDERADVYSLGAILYLMLTGKKYFASSGNMLNDAQVLQDYEGTPLRKLNPGTDADLEVIVHKALRHRPEERYRCVKSLLDDLDKYRKGEPISARPITLLEVFWKTVLRNKGISAGIAVAALFIFLSAVVSVVLINQKRVLAEQAERDALEAKTQLKETMIRSDFFQGVSYLERGESGKAAAYLFKAWQEGAGWDALAMMHHLLEHKNWWVPRGELPPVGIRELSFSATSRDGNFLAVVTSGKELRLINTSEQKIVASKILQNQTLSLAVQPRLAIHPLPGR